MNVLILSAYEYDKGVMSHKELLIKYHQVKGLTGVDVWSLNNRGKSSNRFDINVLGGNSGGGRLGAIQKSIFNIK